MQYKLSEEVADDQLEMLFNHYRCDFDLLEPSQQSGMSANIPKVKIGIMQGYLEIKKESNTLVIIQHLENEYDKIEGSVISYGEVNAKIRRMIPDPSDRVNHYTRVYALLQGLSGLSKNQFDSLRTGDLDLAESLGSLFFLF